MRAEGATIIPLMLASGHAATRVVAAAAGAGTDLQRWDMGDMEGRAIAPPTPREVQAIRADAPHYAVRSMLRRCRRFARWRDCLHLIYTCENIGVECVMMTSHVLLESQRLTEAHSVLRLARSKNMKGLYHCAVSVCMRG